MNNVLYPEVTVFHKLPGGKVLPSRYVYRPEDIKLAKKACTLYNILGHRAILSMIEDDKVDWNKIR